MVSKIQATAAPSTESGSIFNRCTQSLRRLVDSITQVIANFFKMICPCLFGRKEEKGDAKKIPAVPVYPQVCPVKGLSVIPEEPETAITPRRTPSPTRNKEELEPLKTPRASKEEEAPSSEEGEMVYYEADSDDAAAAASLERRSRSREDMGSVIEKLRKMGTLKREEYLDAHYPSAPDSVAASEKKKPKSGTLVEGELHFPPQQYPAAFCLAVTGIQNMAEAIGSGHQIDRHLVDGILKDGLSWYNHCTEGSDEPVEFPYAGVCQNMEAFTPMSLVENEDAKIEKMPSGTFHRRVRLMKDQAKNHPYLGAIIFEGDLTNNPKVFGVVAKHTVKGNATRFYLLDPYGDRQNLVCRRFDGFASFSAAFGATSYSMIVLAPKKREEASAAAGASE